MITAIVWVLMVYQPFGIPTLKFEDKQDCEVIAAQVRWQYDKTTACVPEINV